MKTTTLLLLVAVLVFVTPKSAFAGSRAEAEEQFEKDAVGFQDWVGYRPSTGQFVGTWSVPFRGKYQHPLNGVDFYDYVGRTDLADRYRTKNAVKWTIFGISGAVALSGLVVMLVGPLARPVSILDTGTGSMTPLMVGLGLSLAGTVGLLVAGFLNPHPVKPPEMREIADTYNKSLRKKLGLSGTSDEKDDATQKTSDHEVRRDAPQPTFALSPTLVPGGAGVAFAMTW